MAPGLVPNRTRRFFYDTLNLVFACRRNKYNATKTTIDGITFPSKLEADVYCYLQMLQRGGQIKELKHYDSVALVAKNGNKYRYKPDFRLFDISTNRYVWVEAKGFETDTWKRNKAAWKLSGPGPLWIFKSSGKRGQIYLCEVVVGPQAI